MTLYHECQSQRRDCASIVTCVSPCDDALHLCEGCRMEEGAFRALADLREAVTDAYKSGRIPAEPFVRAGNVLAESLAQEGK